MDSSVVVRNTIADPAFVVRAARVHLTQFCYRIDLTSTAAGSRGFYF